MKRNIGFSVYNHNLVIKDNQIITRKFIVLRNSNGFIVAWTDFHRYIKSGKYHYAKNVASDGGNRHYYICMLLNFVFFDNYQIKKLRDITVPMVKDFLNKYGMGELNKDDNIRGVESVNNCVQSIVDFLDELLRVNGDKMKFKAEDLYTTKLVQGKNNKIMPKKIPVFDVNYIKKDNVIFRDMPKKVMKVFFYVIYKKHTNILMLAALQAFAGLRPSEACNVRREDSPLGPGLRFKYVDGNVVDIEIDLRKELVLRSDSKITGRIKKERVQRVHEDFIDNFVKCYEIYMKYIDGKKYEKEYGALTNNRQGKAYTYQSYYNEFKKVVKDVIHELLNSNDEELVYYGQLLMENNVSPHTFRHYFTVALIVDCHLEFNELMTWRGDRSPESAITYIQNKGDLEKQYKKMNDNLLDFQMWAADKHMEEND